MRLIDANKLKQDVLDWETCYNGFSDTYDKAMIIGEIDAQPTIDAEPTRYGKWIKDEITTRCSKCGCAPISKITFHGEKIWELFVTEEYHYCPYCGTRMDKE